MNQEQITSESIASEIVTSQPCKYYITLPELADVFGITPQAAVLVCKQNRIENFKVGNKNAFAPSEARRFLTARGIKYPAQVIAFQMLKGGSTKTSSAFNLAVRLNSYGARVLAVDLDMQGNLTEAFGLEVTDETTVMMDVARGERDITEVVQPISDGLDLIPSSFENSTLDFLITSKRSALQSYIKNILSPIRANYDFVIIDCNPALSSLNISIALAADTVIIPVNPDKFSKNGLEKTVEELTRIGREHETAINYALLFTLHDARESASQRYLIEYGSQYQGRLISTVIRRNADVKNAIDQKKSIFDFKKASAREDFDLFAQELLGLRNIKKGNA